MANKSFRFRGPTKLIIGNNTISDLGSHLKKLQAERVLIITDQTISQIGILKKVQELLCADGLKTFTYSDVLPEPPVENANDSLRIFKQNDCQAIVGIGGGSAIDVAKAVAMLATNLGTFQDYIGIDRVPKKGAPLILVPTTSGTGSEVSVVSIMTVNGSKAGVLDENITANIALVDPLLTLSVPREITAATGIDAFCHHIESYLSKDSNPFCEMFCLKGIELISRYLRKAVADGRNEEARYWMSYASTLGGYVMNLTDGAAANHALAFAIGAKFHISHGLSNAILIRHVLPVVGLSELEKMRKISGAMGLDLKNLSDRAALEITLREIHTLINDVGCDIPLRNFNIMEDNLNDLVAEAKSQTRVMGHSSYQLTDNEIWQIFSKAL